MLSLAWLTVFIIFVYVPGLTLNAIESSSTQSLSGSGSEAQSDTSAALVAPSLVRGDDFANEKQFLRTNKPAEANANNISTTPATQTSAQLPTLVSGNAHSVTKDPSPSPPSSSSSSSSSSSLLSSLLKIPLTQVTTSTTEATTTTALRTTAVASSTTTTTTTSATRRATTARTWGILNDIEGRNDNGRRSDSDYDQLPSSQKQIQHQQHYQHERHEAQLALSATQYTFAANPTPFPLQLTETIQNTARVITRGNGLNWVYTGLASSESPSVIQTRPEVATRPPLPAIPPSPSSASFMLPLSGASLSASVSPATTLSPSSSVTGRSSSTLPFLSTSANATTTTTTTTTTFSPTPSTTTLSPGLDGYLNITSQAGTHAYLPCNVKQLVKKPISWLRVRDGHILTVDQTTFIADQRFQSIYTPNPERWSLQIKYVQTKDAGTYECQVSTEPKTSAIVSLNIVEPKTELIGESNRHVKAGSQVKLRCIISQALEPPLFINWYHNRKQIYLHNRKGWRTEIERDAAGNVTTDKQITIASLIIPSVSKKDSGNYTCSPSNSEPITVVLHVLNGEYSASAITSGSRRTSNIVRGWCQMLLLQHTLLWVISFLMYFGQLRHHHSRLLPQDITMN